MADLLCTQADVGKGTIGPPRTIRQGLSVSFELNPEGSAYFSSDASRFIYPTYRKYREICVHCLETSSWEERVFQLDGYRLDISTSRGYYYEWKLNAKGTQAYLLGEKKEKEKDVGVLLELNLESGLKREFPGKGWRLSLSADEKTTVMLAGNNQSERIMVVALNFVDLKTRVEAQVLRKFDKNGRGFPERFVRLNAEQFAVAMSGQNGSLVFIDLDKEGK